MTRRIMESFYARNRWAPGGGAIAMARTGQLGADAAANAA